MIQNPGTKIESQDPNLDSDLATNVNNHQKKVQHEGKGPRWD
jgi:hypothetical protein